MIKENKLMGTFGNFREVIKGLKHRNSAEAITKLCPKCASTKISIDSGSGTYLKLYGVTPTKYVCSNCGYNGPIILEQTKEDEKKG